MMKKLILAGLILTAQLFSVSSHAALFDDAEARKKILELEKTMQSQNLASQATQAELNRRLGALEAIVKNGLADMQTQLEALKQENARLKGELEVASHNLETTQQRQKDLYGDTDARLRKLESDVKSVNNSTLGAVEALPPTQDKPDVKAFAEAILLSGAKKHKDAFKAFDDFIKDYPDSALTPEALYGMGDSQFWLKNYKSSMATQRKVLELYPSSAKVPDATYSIAKSQIQLGLVQDAKKTLRDLITKFPNSELIPSAQKLLKATETIK